MIPGFYNHNYQILQTPDHVVIVVEMIHDARIIPLEGRSHGPSGVGQWLGNSRARWEGDTLVVETSGFSPKHDERAVSNGLYLVHASGAQLQLVERFTRVDADTIDYRFHGQRSADLSAAMDRFDSDEPHRRAALRVRLPRGATTAWRTSCAGARNAGEGRGCVEIGVRL